MELRHHKNCCECIAFVYCLVAGKPSRKGVLRHGGLLAVDHGELLAKHSSLTSMIGNVHVEHRVIVLKVDVFGHNGILLVDASTIGKWSQNQGIMKNDNVWVLA